MEELPNMEENPHIEETHHMEKNFHMDKQKTVMILAGIAVILVIVLVVIMSFSNDTFFQDLIGETLDKYPYTIGLGRADDGSYMYYKLNPHIPGFLSWDDSLGALKYINQKLGFTPALYEKMVNTTSEMGVQTDSNSKFEVTWTYSSESGLYVIYERN